MLGRGSERNRIFGSYGNFFILKPLGVRNRMQELMCVKHRLYHLYIPIPFEIFLNHYNISVIFHSPQKNTVSQFHHTLTSTVPPSPSLVIIVVALLLFLSCWGLDSGSYMHYTFNYIPSQGIILLVLILYGMR